MNHDRSEVNIVDHSVTAVYFVMAVTLFYILSFIIWTVIAIEA